MSLNWNSKYGQMFLQTFFAYEGARAKSTNYSVLNGVLNAGDHVPIDLQRQPKLRGEARVDRKTVVVFADDRPNYDWGHLCRYILVDADSLEVYREIDATLPPIQNPSDDSTSFTLFHCVWQPNMVPSAAVPPPDIWRPRAKGRRYALLYSGWTNQRHLNDLEFMYRTLIDVYAYDPKDITVLNLDGTASWWSLPGDYKQVTPVLGTSWPGNSPTFTLKVDGPGSVPAFQQVIETLRHKLKAHDSLLFFATNHGYIPDTEVCLYAYDSIALAVSECCDELRKLPHIENLMVVLQPCYSGAFIAPILAHARAANIAIATASGPCTQSSVDDDPTFSRFAGRWISAMAGATPLGSPVLVGTGTTTPATVTAKQAFDYAQATVGADMPMFRTKGKGETMVLGTPLVTTSRLPLVLNTEEHAWWLALVHEGGAKLDQALERLDKIQLQAEISLSLLEATRRTAIEGAMREMSDLDKA